MEKELYREMWQKLDEAHLLTSIARAKDDECKLRMTAKQKEHLISMSKSIIRVVNENTVILPTGTTKVKVRKLTRGQKKQEMIEYLKKELHK